MSSPARRARLGLTVGDPAGIGPEIVARCLEDDEIRASLDLVVIGPAALRPADVPLFASGASAARLEWLESAGGEPIEVGKAQASGGAAALAALRAGHDLATSGTVEALVTAPVSKESLHLAGERVEGQTQLLAAWSGKRVEMMALAGNLRVLLYTRHMALRAALDQLDTARVAEFLVFLHAEMRGWGFERPRLALAGLNPHAGEGGLFGDEEAQVLEPAASLARDRGVDVAGPISPDTLFARAAAGVYDAVLALYHDQAFLPVKTLAPDTALTVLCGLPYLRFSPAHGTAFDIAGRGLASPANLKSALLEAARWAVRARSD